MGFNPVFGAAIVVCALSSVIMRKPLAVVLLLIIFFPVNTILFLLFASYAAVLATKKLFPDKTIFPDKKLARKILNRINPRKLEQ